MQARLDRICGLKDGISFFGDRHRIDVLVATTSSDHLPIFSLILVGNVLDSKPSTLFKLNVSHLDSLNFRAVIHIVCNLVPRPCGHRGWLLWWEATIHHTLKFIRGWVV